MIGSLRRRWDLRYGAAVGAVLAVALALRVWGIRSGLPWVYNVDEADHFVSRAAPMLGGNLEPGYWDNPPAFTYLLAVLFRVWFGGRAAFQHTYRSADPTEVWLLARLASAVLGTIAVWLLCLAGARFFGRRAGLLAAAAMAVAFLPVFYAKLALNDVPALVGVCLALWGSAGVLRGGRRRDYAIAGLGLGLAAATKYTGGIVVFVLLATCLARARGPDGGRRAAASLALAGVVAVATFIAVDPYALIDFHAFKQGLVHQSTESGSVNGKLGLTHGSGISYYLWSLTWGVGSVPALAALAGVALLARRDRWACLALAGPAVAFLVFMGLQGRYFGRWVMPIVPIVCLLGAYAAVAAVDRLAPRPGRLRAALLAVAAIAVCVQGALDSIHAGVVNSRTDTRTVARDWLIAHVPAGARIVVEPIAPRAWTRPFVGLPVFLTHRRADGTLGVRAGATVTLEDYERVLSPALIGLYERAGYCWVVTGSTEEGRARVDPGAVPAAIAYYRTLAVRGTRAFAASPYSAGASPVRFNFDWSFDYYPGAYARPGPQVAVYRLHGGRCAAP